MTDDLILFLRAFLDLAKPDFYGITVSGLQSRHAKSWNLESTLKAVADIRTLGACSPGGIEVPMVPHD